MNNLLEDNLTQFATTSTKNVIKKDNLTHITTDITRLAQKVFTQCNSIKDNLTRITTDITSSKSVHTV